MVAMKREDIVALAADLAKHTDLHILASATPERFSPRARKNSS